MTPDERLKDAAELFEKRSKTYGDSYKRFGHVLDALFPDGISVDGVEEMNRLGVLIMMVAKFDRYCKNFHSGGHGDSLLDLSVYSAMLAELDEDALANLNPVKKTFREWEEVE